VELCLADVHEAIAAAQPGRECLVARDRRLTWGEITERTRRLASYLHDQGLGCHTERAELAPWESGQDHLGLYLYNRPEYLEGMLGAYKARLAPFNVNYRYVAGELRRLLIDAAPAGLVLQSCFAPVFAQVRGDLERARPPVVLQVPDDSGVPLLPGAAWYEDALAAGSADGPPVRPSPDDLYLLFTGGTTGSPKGVLWRQGDAWSELFGGSRSATTLDEVVGTATTRLRALAAPPLMHGASQLVSFNAWFTGGTVFLQDHPERLDPADTWRVVERERVTLLVIVGDAFARPLIDELDRQQYDLASLTVLLTGGAPLSAGAKQEFQTRLPSVMVVDSLASSETGGHGLQVLAGGPATSGTFSASRNTAVLSADLRRQLRPGDTELGWLAKRGRMALGYLGDRAATERVFPIVDGERFGVPGDRAHLLADGTIELHGRDATTINSGGEKVFAEEVEAALKAHAGVYDCLVAGRPSERWGEEVVAVVRLRPGWMPGAATEAALEAAAGERVARYKLPKAYVFVEEVPRAPSGKADYQWARAIAAGKGTDSEVDSTG
jgi:fatty-acyl-CoA synthase